MTLDVIDVPGATFDAADKLVDLMGATHSQGINTFGWGYAADNPFGSDPHNAPWYRIRTDTNEGSLIVDDGDYQATEMHDERGNWLIRSTGGPVPEPSTWTLFGAALGALVWRLRGKRTTTRAA